MASNNAARHFNTGSFNMGHRDNEEERRKLLENAIPFLTPTIFVVPDTRLPFSRNERENNGGKIIPLVREMDDNYR